MSTKFDWGGELLIDIFRERGKLQLYNSYRDKA